MKSVLIVAIAATLAGCASITGSKMQPISVQTTLDSREVSGLGCTLMNDEGKWFVTSPGSVVIRKSTADLTVECALKNGFSGNAQAVSKANLNIWGNLLVGGVIGYVVDRKTGAGFDYPAVITVPVRQVGPAGSAQTGYTPRSTYSPSAGQ